jgi:hypothetical protein
MARAPRTAVTIATFVTAVVVAETTTAATFGGSGKSEINAPASLAPFFTWSTTIGDGAIVTISDQGNIMRFESPFDYEHIGVGAFSEGYVLCYTPSAGEPVNAYDTGEFESGFDLAATTVSPVTVSRKTSDGVLNFQQRFNADLGADRLSITMRVTNLTPSPVTDAALRRVVDFDIDTGGAMGWAAHENWFARSEADGVLAWNDEARADALGGSFEAHQMVLGHRISSLPRDAQVIGGFLEATCSPSEVAGSESAPVGPADYGASLAYDLGTVGPGVTKTVVIQYVQD